METTRGRGRNGKQISLTAAQHHELAAQAHHDAAKHHRSGFACKAQQAAMQAQLHSMKAREASSITYITVEYTVASY